MHCLVPPCVSHNVFPNTIFRPIGRTKLFGQSPSRTGRTRSSRRDSSRRRFGAHAGQQRLGIGLGSDGRGQTRHDGTSLLFGFGGHDAKNEAHHKDYRGNGEKAPRRHKAPCHVVGVCVRDGALSGGKFYIVEGRLYHVGLGPELHALVHVLVPGLVFAIKESGVGIVSIPSPITRGGSQAVGFARLARFEDSKGLVPLGNGRFDASVVRIDKVLELDTPAIVGLRAGLIHVQTQPHVTRALWFDVHVDGIASRRGTRLGATLRPPVAVRLHELVLRFGPDAVRFVLEQLFEEVVVVVLLEISQKLEMGGLCFHKNRESVIRANPKPTGGGPRMIQPPPWITYRKVTIHLRTAFPLARVTGGRIPKTSFRIVELVFSDATPFVVQIDVLQESNKSNGIRGTGTENQQLSTLQCTPLTAAHSK